MAKATKRPVSDYELTLVLSRQEAENLRYVVGKAPHTAASRATYRALGDAGVEMVQAESAEKSF